MGLDVETLPYRVSVVKASRLVSNYASKIRNCFMEYFRVEQIEVLFADNPSFAIMQAFLIDFFCTLYLSDDTASGYIRRIAGINLLFSFFTGFELEARP